MKENLSMNLKSIYESIISEESHCPETITEDKTSLIKNRLVLPDIEDSEEKEKFKATLVDFFKRHPNYENKIDWNKAKTLTRKDFDEVLSLEGSLSGEENAVSTEKSILNIFKSVKGRKFEIVGENSKWLFVAPLNWEAAVYCDSSENQGTGAKWCIGYEESSSYWNDYTSKGSVFVMAFNKSYREMSKEELQNNLKYMIQRDENGKYHLWTQKDKDIGEDLKVVGENATVAERMFSKAKDALDAVKVESEKKANEKAEKILSGLKEIDEHTFDDELKPLITDIIIPNSVTSIGESAFSHCYSLTSITIPDSVTSIEYGAFYECKKLASITIPDSVTSIGESVFSGCESLTSITIPDSVTSIEDYTFHLCEKLTSINIPNSVTSIEDYTFAGCKIIASINIPNSVTNIGEYAFYSCFSLTSINIPDSVTSIGAGAFEYCTKLTSFEIPNSVTSIGYGGFSHCYSLTSITIPDSVTSIGNYAFFDCFNLTSITIPDSVTSIGESVFSGCESLTSISIPDSVTSIGKGAFSNVNPNTVVTVSKNFNKELLEGTGLTTKARIRVI